MAMVDPDAFDAVYTIAEEQPRRDREASATPCEDAQMDRP